MLPENRAAPQPPTSTSYLAMTSCDASPLPSLWTTGDKQIVTFANRAFLHRFGAMAPEGEPLSSSISCAGLEALLARVQSTKRAESMVDVALEPRWEKLRGERRINPALRALEGRRWTVVATPMVACDSNVAHVWLQLIKEHAAGDPSLGASPEAVLREERHDAMLVNERLLVATVREHERASQAERIADGWSALLENLGEGVAVADSGHGPVLLNPVGRALLTLGDGPLSVADCCAVPMRAADGAPLTHERHPLRRALAGERFAEEEHIVDLDGLQRRVVVTGTAIDDSTGTTRAMIVFRDVTELRKLEQLRTECVALISHDLRNPLHSIAMRAEVLQRQLAPTDAAQTHVAAIARLAQRMNRMIEDLVLSSMADADALSMQLTPVPFAGIVQPLLEAFGSPEDRARLHYEGSSAAQVNVDVRRLERALTNVIANALKYASAPTPVVVSLSEHADHVVFSVRDQGPGIDPAEHAHVFEKYKRVGATRAREGFGLGLYVTRQIVEAHGGHIDIESALGSGCTFRIALPIAQVV